MYRKLRDPYAAVLQCFVTDMDRIDGRKGQAVPAFSLFHLRAKKLEYLFFFS